ncbi:Serine/threonine protein kinase [Friedmanniella luteola]|uniref:non-specific serine/threonine protein kinase n=1 Tax=Friedmanniella luteola TaxID=546871 RepID=A0A1H2A8P6_9ACTN|nr:serine/threonine-protein kinase [Friedmanniella luteola]SDT42253.1 Serine/threonine protein kinase [Friedmanniella luteola]
MAEQAAVLEDRAEHDRDDDVAVVAVGAEIAPGYRVAEHLRRGDALDVYAVFSDERLCSCVAKVVRPDRAAVERVRRRLAQEGFLLQTLTHPLLVRGLATFTQPEVVVIMETIPGPTLEEIIEDRASRLAAAELCHLGSQVAAAAHYLHQSGYLHLDVRPSNIVSHGGIAKLIDLSLARPAGPVPRGFGSHLYMSPEQATGSHVTEAADTWAIGATLYEAAAGIGPFDAHDAADAAVLDRDDYLQLRRPAPPLRRFGRRLPSGLAALIEACLHPDPQLRPSARAVWQGLQEVLTHLGPAEPAAPGLAPGQPVDGPASP